MCDKLNLNGNSNPCFVWFLRIFAKRGLYKILLKDWAALYSRGAYTRDFTVEDKGFSWFLRKPAEVRAGDI